MKKIFKFLICTCLCITAFGCSKQPEKLSLNEIIDKVYEGIPEDQMPMMLELFPINEENEEWFFGTKEIEYKDALASESGVGSVPHSVVLIETEKSEDTKAVKEKLKKSIDGYKWVCVGVHQKDILIKSHGNIVIMIIDGFNLGPTILDNFNKLF